MSSPESAAEHESEHVAEYGADSAAGRATERATERGTERGSRVARGGVTLVLGVLVAWFTWDAVGNLLALPELFTQLGLADEIPWAILVLGVAMPIVYYLAGVLIGIRLPLARLTLVLIASLAAIAATRMSLIAAVTGTITLLG